MKSCLAVTLSLATVCGAVLPGQERAASDWLSTPIADQLRSDAMQLQANAPDLWQQCAAQVSALFEQHATLRKGWIRQRPPPPPDLASLNLPVAYLAQLWPKPGDSKSHTGVFVIATALTQCSDGAGIDFLLEYHYIETDPRYAKDPNYQYRRRHASAIVQALTKSLPASRAQGVIAAQLARSPKVTAQSLLFQLLRRFRKQLPATMRTAGRDWLTSYQRGPANWNPEEIWKLRLEFGDAKDRDALIPHVLGEDLLYCLTVILHAPLPHPGLATALRDRRERMTDHERSYLSTHMRCALAVTDPEREVGSFLDRMRELQQRIIDSKATRDEETEYSRLLDALCDINHEQAHLALHQFVKNEQLPWSNRCWALQKLILKSGSKTERTQAEQLRQWWMRTAPEGYRRQLQEALDYARNGE